MRWSALGAAVDRLSWFRARFWRGSLLSVLDMLYAVLLDEGCNLFRAVSTWRG